MDIPWPYKDEFEVGWTIEHAQYAVTWLTAFFGPVESITAFASCQIPDKQADISPEIDAPDVSVACLKFISGVVGRLTCSWIAPSDHSLRIFGDEGILCTDDIWRPQSPVYIKRYIAIGGKTMLAPWEKRYSLAGPPSASLPTRVHQLIARSPRELIRSIRARARHLRKRVDFCLGPAELAAAIKHEGPCRLSPRYCLHTNEVVLAIHNASEAGSTYKVTTSFPPLDPMPWAKS